jgi:methionyl aminopeptidase
MSIRSNKELEKLRIIVRKALDTTAAAVQPGITTGELDKIGARVLAENGAESAPPKVYGFPERYVSASMTKPSMEFQAIE